MILGPLFATTIIHILTMPITFQTTNIFHARPALSAAQPTTPNESSLVTK